MATFDFVFMCMILYTEKCEINYASKTPQKKDIGLGESAFMFVRVCEHICDLRNLSRTVEIRSRTGRKR
jgi:hypothetical protein